MRFIIDEIHYLYMATKPVINKMYRLTATEPLERTI